MANLRSQLAKMQLIDPLSEEEIKDQFVRQEIINYANLKWGKK